MIVLPVGWTRSEASVARHSASHVESVFKLSRHAVVRGPFPCLAGVPIPRLRAGLMSHTPASVPSARSSELPVAFNDLTAYFDRHQVPDNGRQLVQQILHGDPVRRVGGGGRNVVVGYSFRKMGCVSSVNATWLRNVRFFVISSVFRRRVDASGRPAPLGFQHCSAPRSEVHPTYLLDGVLRRCSHCKLRIPW